jgi:phage head maturation protease
MSDTTNQQFKIVAAITGYTLRKSADGTENYVLSGMASNANIDLTGERMADTALAAMARRLEANAVTINNEHGGAWDDNFGEVTKLWVTDSHELMMEAELEPDHYRTKTLIKALDKGKKLGLSIGGAVKEAAMEVFADLGRKVMAYKDIALFHAAITGTPAVADTWVTPIPNQS